MHQLDDAAWKSAYAPKIGDVLVAGSAVFIRLVCAGCALSSSPQPVWVERGSGTATCPACERRKREALETPLTATMRPNPNARRGEKSDGQYNGAGRWYME